MGPALEAYGAAVHPAAAGHVAPPRVQDRELFRQRDVDGGSV